MSTSTESSYAYLLGGMWGPEGSEVDARLKRLQELEKIRKEREAVRAAAKNTGRGVGIVRTERIKSSEPEAESSGFRFRRALSLRDEDTGNYGGARPKFGGYSTYGQENNESSHNIFSGISLNSGSRPPLRGAGDYSSRSYSRPEGDANTNLFSSFSSSYKTTKPAFTSRSYYTSGGRNESQNEEDTQNGFDNEFNNGQDLESNVFENGDHNDDSEEEDHGEEPIHFIERLKNGNGNSQLQTNTYIQSMPDIPPLDQSDYGTESVEIYYQDIPDLVQPTDDILSVAKEISTTFGNLESPTPTKYGNGQNSYPKERFSKGTVAEDPNVSVTYEIDTVDYDSSGDEAGKILPVRESMYHASTSEWNVLDQTSGKLDEMHEFFTGTAPGEDPNISRELDGGSVKAELEKSFSKPKTPKISRNDVRKTPTSLKKSAKKENNENRSKSPLDKLKSSESENDSVVTSESENDTTKMRTATPKKPATPSSAKKGEKHGMSLSDKLAKLESLTQEKKRKHSFSESEIKKPVPSYMSGTSSSQKKRARGKDASPNPSRDLKKDVREIKKFVHEHASEPSTPVSSPTKQFTEVIEFTNINRKTTKEMSIQTDFVIDFPDINYVCKHCGKSSFEEVQSPSLTEENLNKAFGHKSKRESPNNEKAKPVENKMSSKDSVKSLGETSTKSERSYRYKPKAVSGTQGYMKGTTSSRLRTNANNVPETDGKARKGSAPEIVHRAELESAKGTSLKGNVSRKTKAIESSRRENKPTLSLFRGSSVERNKPETTHKASQLVKSKSVDQVHIISNKSQKSVNNTELKKQTSETKVKAENSEVKDVSPEEKKDITQMKKKAPSPPKIAPKPSAVEKLDLSSLDSPRSELSPRSPKSFKKPPLASPGVKDTEISPRSETSEVVADEVKSVESKGQFTTIEDNPFIKNDSPRRNSLRGHDKTESVWEKAESRSRDSSLKRSNSTSEANRERPSSTSSLKRHNTSAGEKSSVSDLTWSDSGSTGSLRGSKSSLHGSNTSLNKEEKSAFSRPRTVSTSSTTSQTSQNAMLNLLSPIGTTRNPVSGAVETDVDAAYNDHIKDTKSEHNEESVNRAHLEFARKACNMLEFDMKKRDSSNESDKDKGKSEDDKENNNNYKKVNGEMNGEDTGSVGKGTGNGRKEKGRKGLRKLFKK